MQKYWLCGWACTLTTTTSASSIHVNRLHRQLLTTMSSQIIHMSTTNLMWFFLWYGRLATWLLAVASEDDDNTSVLMMSSLSCVSSSSAHCCCNTNSNTYRHLSALLSIYFSLLLKCSPIVTWRWLWRGRSSIWCL